MEKMEDLLYVRLMKEFKWKGYTFGTADQTPLYTLRDYIKPEDLTVGHYANAIHYCDIKFKDVPEKYRTREFFLQSLSGCTRDIVEYVKAHPERFDRQFFKDHIATSSVALEFELNDFEYMPLEFIDEEMVMYAMLCSIPSRRGTYDDWFFSVHRRKPELLTELLYDLGARYFAKRIGNEIPFLDITPKEYLTREYYFLLCLDSFDPVMDFIPEKFLTENFLCAVLAENLYNIGSFSEEALERTILIDGYEPLKFWQLAIKSNGYLISQIPPNEERAEFFMSLYDEKSSEYRVSFKDHRIEYIWKKAREAKLNAE